MALNKRQKKQFFKIRREQGKEAAQQYKQGIMGNPADAPNPNFDYSNPQSVAQAQKRENVEAATASAPNINTVQGGRQVAIDPETGQATVTETLAPQEQQRYDQAMQGQLQQGQMYNQFMQQGMQQGAFVPQYQQTAPIMSTQLPGPQGGVVPLQQFEQQRQQLEQNAMQSFNAANQEQFGLARQQMEQQLANEGVPPGSEQYNRRMKSLLDSQAQASGQAMRDAYSSSFGAAQGAQGLNLQANQQTYGQALGNYMLPHQLAAQYSGALNYQTPQFGAISQLPVNPVNIGNIGVAYNEADLARQKMIQDAELAREGFATQRQTAGAGSLGLGARQQLLAQEHQNQMDLMLQQQAIQAANNADL